MAKKTVPSKSRRRTSWYHNPLVLISFLILVSVFFGFLIWKMQTVATLAPTDASANQANTITCKDTIRARFDNNLREGKRWQIAGSNPQGVFTKDGILNLQTGNMTSSSQNSTATLNFVPQVKGNFVYQTHFLGVENPTAGQANVDLNFSFGKERVVGRVERVSDGYRITPIYTSDISNNANWETSDAIAIQAPFRFRFFKRKNTAMIMVRQMAAPRDAQMRVIWQKELVNADEKAKLQLNSVMFSVPAAAKATAKSNARFQNFRVFCPSEIQREWITDSDEL